MLNKFPAVKPWKEIEYFDENFKNRIRVMAPLIEDGKSVLDLGCGKEWLKEFLPEHCIYMPVDYTKRSEETIICDFNEKQFPLVKADIAFISGCLEYILDYKWFIKKISDSVSSVIISYCSLEDVPNLQVRRQLNWVNDLTSENLICEFLNNEMILTHNISSNNQQIFKFTKKICCKR